MKKILLPGLFNYTEAQSVAYTAFWNSVLALELICRNTLQQLGVAITDLPKDVSKSTIANCLKGLSFEIKTGENPKSLKLECLVVEDTRIRFCIYYLDNNGTKEMVAQYKWREIKVSGFVTGKFISVDEFADLLPKIAEVMKKQ